MTDTYATIERAALLERFWRPNPVYPTLHATSRHIALRQAAKCLGVPSSTLWHRLGDGTLPIITEIVNSRRRIVRASFDAWMAETAAKAA